MVALNDNHHQPDTVNSNSRRDWWAEEIKSSKCTNINNQKNWWYFSALTGHLLKSEVRSRQADRQTAFSMQECQIRIANERKTIFRETGRKWELRLEMVVTKLCILHLLSLIFILFFLPGRKRRKRRDLHSSSPLHCTAHFIGFWLALLLYSGHVKTRVLKAKMRI